MYVCMYVYIHIVRYVSYHTILVITHSVCVYTYKYIYIYIYAYTHTHTCIGMLVIILNLSMMHILIYPYDIIHRIVYIPSYSMLCILY